MVLTEKGLELIKMFEGFSATPYLCEAGYRTIGYGHVIRLGENLQNVTETEATVILLRDIANAERAVWRLIGVPLEANQYDSLVSFCFNLGGGSLQRSTLRQKLNRGEYYEAAEEFPKWCYAGGKKSKGLLKRRLIEKEVFLYGDYPI